MKHTRKHTLAGAAAMLLAAVALLCTACEAEEEFSSWACRFDYDNSIYLDDVLASAMSSEARGVFCRISESTRGGVKYLTFVSSDGRQSEKRQTAMEQEASYIIGLNNGIIVGFQTLNTEPNGGFTAYDVQCPNCVRRNNNTANPNYPVAMAGTGIATCTRCGDRYDMNNGGILQEGQEGDTGLEKYVATTTGPQGFVSVRRR